MRKLAALLVVPVLVLLLPPAFGQDKEETLIGTLSELEPEARQILESIVSDTRKMLNTLKKAAAHKGTDKSASVDLWNQAMQEHIDVYNRKYAEARKKARTRALAEAGNPKSDMVRDSVKTWPADWHAWGNAQLDFFKKLLKGEFIEWRFRVNEKIASLEAGLEKDPKKFKELREQAQWISDEMKDSWAKAESATSAAEVDKELSRFIRIYKVAGNIERTIKERKKYVVQYFDDESQKVSKINEGYEKARAFMHECQDIKLLDLMCKHAANAFGVRAYDAVEFYTKAYDEVKAMNKPVLEETLFDDIEGFKGEKFEIMKATERLEKFLHARRDSFN